MCVCVCFCLVFRRCCRLCKFHIMQYTDTNSSTNFSNDVGPVDFPGVVSPRDVNETSRIHLIIGPFQTRRQLFVLLLRNSAPIGQRSVPAVNHRRLHSLNHGDAEV